ncbi:MAG: hypothetical protein MJ095_00210 [Oscillospiraceae bacterium]|nr:hypothetical protein [Oscillospiraceae bacterium]
MLKVKYGSNNYITLPEPQALTPERNKIWSANTGRLDSGLFVGDLIAIKRKLNISWGPMTASDAKKIINAVNQQYVKIKYTGEDGEEQEGEFYWGDLSGDVYNLTVSHIMSGFTCNAIER